MSAAADVDRLPTKTSKRGGRLVPVQRLITAVSASAFVALATVSCSGSNDTGPAGASSVLGATPTTLSSQDASRLTTALTSEEPATIASVLAPEVKAAFLKSPKRLLPAGANMEIFSDQMLVSGDEATVPVKITGGTDAGIYLLTLENSGGQWLLIGTVKK